MPHKIKVKLFKITNDKVIKSLMFAVNERDASLSTEYDTDNAPATAKQLTGAELEFCKDSFKFTICKLDDELFRIRLQDYPIEYSCGIYGELLALNE